MASLAGVLAHSWAQFVVSTNDFFRLSVWGLSPFAVMVALNHGYVLRSAIHREVHWARLFFTHVIMTCGSGALIDLLLSRPLALATNPLILASLTLAHTALFHCPGDLCARAYAHPSIRPLWRVISAVQVARSASTTMDAVRGLAAWGNAATGPSPLQLVFFGVVSAVGGGLILEFINGLLLPRSLYHRPRGGPAANLVLALWTALFHTFVLRGVGAGGMGVPAFLRSLPVVGGAVVAPLLASLPAGLRSARYPLDPDTARAAAVLFAVGLAFSMPGGALVSRTGRLLSLINPGFKPTLTPASLNAAARGDTAAPARPAAPVVRTPQPWPLDGGLFGYEFSPADFEDSSEGEGEGAGAGAGGRGAGEDDEGDEALLRAALPYLLSAEGDEDDDDGDGDGDGGGGNEEKKTGSTGTRRRRGPARKTK